MLSNKKIQSVVKGPVYQEIKYDPVSGKIEVIHYFNLKPGVDVVLEKIEKSVTDDQNARVLLKGSTPPKKGCNFLAIRKPPNYVTTFTYRITKSSIQHDHARKFPLRGTSYPLSNVPHTIEVILKD